MVEQETLGFTLNLMEQPLFIHIFFMVMEQVFLLVDLVIHTAELLDIPVATQQALELLLQTYLIMLTQIKIKQSAVFLDLT